MTPEDLLARSESLTPNRLATFLTKCFWLMQRQADYGHVHCEIYERDLKLVQQAAKVLSEQYGVAVVPNQGLWVTWAPSCETEENGVAPDASPA